MENRPENQQQPNQRNPGGGGWDWDKIFKIAAGATAIAAVGVGIYAAMSAKEMTLAVDATGKKGGGILRIGSKNATTRIVFYSVDWTQWLEFPPSQEPDKFELVNAMLALHSLPEITDEFTSPGKFTLKSDNYGVTITNSYRRDGDNDRLLKSFKSKVSEYGADVQHHGTDDKDMYFADKLSRNASRSTIETAMKDHYKCRNTEDVSEEVRDLLREFIDRYVPDKYKK